ncbi:hypothetical protein D4764_10G0012000 [Takifugu flavidus]|uniref:Uncharacterized protein n=1 Tax=Takifugu flavidus TaxID=433684 RepID=A0A5C6PPI2_9TELE|nr:hypothetical protein D4764_10G0012000 [Takifugu flavidus]
MSFLCRVAGLSLRDRVRSSDIREELGVEPLLLHIERSQLGWLGHLASLPSGRLPFEVFRTCPTGRRPRGRPRTRGSSFRRDAQTALSPATSISSSHLLPSQARDVIPPPSPGPAMRSPPGGTCPEHLEREASGRQTGQMPEPPQLTPFDEEEQRFYSELLPDVRASHPISKAEPGHPAEETHFSCLYRDLVLSVITQH